ncbi:Zn-dependent protease [Lysobacter helvus]|uniref:Zn-dependent protease n=2 Tax=Lysobacteraceae TaxID=32033 RepID=A0ABN6FV00_9GAMM|nr:MULTISPECIES: M48 family metallopeptidase [Lysobacter]BCT92774.1 Zn-dependent protease [Lysobacter caseinilyticus]BCT95927.1 Zn-dependent protease [Lysobacter helvus]
MNFFERQAAARRSSSRLVLLFALAVAGMVLAVDGAAWLVFGSSGADPGETGALLAFTTLLTIGIVGLGSLYRIASLRGGGEPVAQQMGGTPVAADTTDFSMRRLRNVVEEIAIASGVPVPKIYVLEEESAINAFAAGYSPSDAVIAVTRGALDKLNRDELQGVIAHEFSHILNGDMRLNIRLMGVLFGILMMGIIGRKILVNARYGGRNNKGAGVIMIAALIAIVVGYVGVFFGRMIKAGVARQRETLADASAVQFTRQTTGLAGALKKIGGLDEGSRLTASQNTEEVSHMLFGEGLDFSGLFATHPPLLERIQALEPQFRADQLEALQRKWLDTPPDGLEEDVQLGLVSPKDGTLPSPTAQFAVTPPMVVAQVAQPSPDDYKRADAIAERIPDAVRTLAGQRDAVMPLLLGLLLDEDQQVASLQREEIAARLGMAMSEHARQLRNDHLATLHPALRLPLASIAFPVLRLRPRPELDTFLDTVHAIVHADGRVSLFEYCLGRLLQVQVRESLDPSRHARFGRTPLALVRSEISTLLCVVAQCGHEDPEMAKRAYLTGIQRVLPSDHLPYLARPQGALALEETWGPLDGLDPLAKQSLVEGITATIGHDNQVTVGEAELLRTICAALHCPLPPMLETAPRAR